MDKKTEAALLQRRSAPPPEETMTSEAPSGGAPPQPGTGWWVYHGDPEHTGYVSDSGLTAANVGPTSFGMLHELQLGGPVLSVPAVEDGFIYVGLANYQQTPDGSGNGGALHKIEIESGNIVETFSWNLGVSIMEDVHSFTGMGSTPMLTNDCIYFGAFNGIFYCLDKATLKQLWSVNLRSQDLAHNQPVINTNGAPPAAVIWTSPVMSADGKKVYVACGEGENPSLYSFVFCLDTSTGNVNWIYCTNLYVAGVPNEPNVLPVSALQSLDPPPGVGKVPPPQPHGFTIYDGEPIVMGCSVWGAIAYDKDLNRIYCSTGNQQPEPTNNWVSGRFKSELPGLGFSNGVLSLDADTGEYKAFFQVPPESNYRVSDTDVDVGSAPVILNLNGSKVVVLTCKNAGLFILDADTLKLKDGLWRNLLPKMNDGSLIPTVDPHPSDPNAINPHVDNDTSNSTPGENYSGAFNTSAYYPGSANGAGKIPPTLFTAIGGPNYHNASPGIDSDSTPFMRAVDLSSATLADAWPTAGDPPRYTNTSSTDDTTGQTVGMYSSAGESGLSSPAVVNDVVFCTTSKVSIYAFDVRDGKLLWHDDLGAQSDGYNGGYGYCLGPAIWKNYVVAGALVFGRDGGLLRIYGLTPPSKSPTT